MKALDAAASMIAELAGQLFVKVNRFSRPA